MDIAVGIVGQTLRAAKHRVKLILVIRVVVDDNVGGIALSYVG